MAGTLVPSGPSATLVLVRHGESTWIAAGRIQGRRDPPLSPLGREQAWRVAARLADPGRPPALPIPTGPPMAIWHSPLRRAAATARQVAALRPGPPLVADVRLVEMGLGAWEGRSERRIAATDPAFAGWHREPVRVTAPGGEPLAAVDRRVRAAARAILGRLAGSPAELPPWGVIVAHEGALRVLLLALLDLPLARFWTFPFPYCGLTIVELRDGAATLRAHGLTDHLGGPPPGGSRSPGPKSRHTHPVNSADPFRGPAGRRSDV